MGRQANHRARWLHNRDFAGTLPDVYCDWILTSAFYAAVHAVETLFAYDKTRNHASHEARNETLRTTTRYQVIWKFYHELYNASLTTRYHCDPHEWIPVAQIKGDWIPKYLSPLEASVLKLIKDPTALPPIVWELGAVAAPAAAAIPVVIPPRPTDPHSGESI